MTTIAENTNADGYAGKFFDACSESISSGFPVQVVNTADAARPWQENPQDMIIGQVIPKAYFFRNNDFQHAGLEPFPGQNVTKIAHESRTVLPIG